MNVTSTLDRPANADVQLTRSLPAAACDGLEWAISRAQSGDIAAVRVMFLKLHAFNSDLDPRFALSADWEAHFDTMLQHALRDAGSLCLIAREPGTGRPCGLALAAVHRDSGMWRYHEWVEVEALYVDDAWRGCGLADALLARACDWAESIGQPVVQLYVTASNERAINFYRREGFSQTQAIMRRVLAS